MTPATSPDDQDRADSPVWDHTPERLMEDDVFLWQEENLRPLTVLEIKASEDIDEKEINMTPTTPQFFVWQSSNSPLGRYKKRPVMRKPVRGRKPVNSTEVQLDKVSDLSVVLKTDKPVVPEVVDNQRQQDLSLALEVLHQNN